MKWIKKEKTPVELQAKTGLGKRGKGEPLEPAELENVRVVLETLEEEYATLLNQALDDSHLVPEEYNTKKLSPEEGTVVLLKRGEDAENYLAGLQSDVKVAIKHLKQMIECLVYEFNQYCDVLQKGDKQ